MKNAYAETLTVLVVCSVLVFIGRHVTNVHADEDTSVIQHNEPAVDDIVETRVRQFFLAIESKETPGKEDPDNAVGDNGDSLGRYQIQLGYHDDAVEYLDRKGFNVEGCRYQRVRDPEYARTIMMAYFCRYGEDQVDVILDEESTHDEFVTAAVYLSRLHNGGPKGPRRDSTVEYSVAVRQYLAKN